ncbi:hypothetical protein STHAL_01210, partial [Streptomyces halstedii]|nr:hypothetical protein [Streptomyces halstedii]
MSALGPPSASGSEAVPGSAPSGPVAGHATRPDPVAPPTGSPGRLAAPGLAGTQHPLVAPAPPAAAPGRPAR